MFFFQQKYMTPPNPAMTEQQLQQQKMMQVMTPVMFPLMLYNGPSGLNLYIFASTLFGDHREQGDPQAHQGARGGGEGGAGSSWTPSPPGRARSCRADDAPDAEKGGLRGFWADLQAKVEQARRDQERGKNGRR